MANEFYTLIVVPHAKARFRKFQVSVRFAKWVGGVGAALGLLLGAVLVHYTWINVEVAELRRLRSENVALSTKALAYEENATKLQTKLLNLQNMVMKLGVMAGLEKTLPDPPERGRPDGGRVRGHVGVDCAGLSVGDSHAGHQFQHDLHQYVQLGWQLAARAT